MHTVKTGRKNVKQIYHLYEWELLIGFILSCDLLFNRSTSVPEWVLGWYGVDYSMGIGSRFLVGDLLTRLTGGHISLSAVHLFCEITLWGIIVCVSVMMGCVIKGAEEARWAVVFLVLAFLCSPGSIASFWTVDNMGRLETYTLFLTLLSVIQFELLKKRNSNAALVFRYLLVTVASIFSMAIYQGYIFLYFPIIFVVMVCDILREKKHIGKRILWAGSSFIAVCISFLYFQLRSRVVFHSVEEMAEAIRQKVDFSFSETALYYEFFADIKEAYQNLYVDFLSGGEYPAEKTVCVILLLLPVLAIAAALYIKCFRYVKEAKKSIFRTPYIYCLLANLAVLPQFLLNVDWGRWMTAVFINLFFQLLYLYHAEYEEMKRAMNWLDRLVRGHVPLCMACLLYLMIFDKFGARSYFPQVEQLWQDITHVSVLLKK